MWVAAGLDPRQARSYRTHPHRHGDRQMPLTTMTGTEFNRDVSKAKRQARHGPVVITSRGKAEHVLLSMEAYVALTRQEASIADSLAMPEAADVDFEPPRLQVGAYRPATLGERVGHVLYAGSRMGGWR